MFPEQLPAEYDDKQSASPSGFTSQGKSTKTRIGYIDGIRGLAALAVAILHAFQMFGYGLEPVGVVSDALLTGRGIERVLPPLFTNVIQFGAFAVEIFIVISGYSLMLGVARSKDRRPKGGVVAYFKRRVKRIWPPYYAALLLSLLIIAVVPGMNEKSNMYWDLALPVTPGATVSHLLFFHYLTPEWFYRINPPMWTVALEEHIYVLFPFVLLPLWRRMGAGALVLLGSVGSVIMWHLLSPWFGGANFWFIGLFTMGAAAASIGFSSNEGESRWRHRLPWGKISIALLIGFYLLYQYMLRFDDSLMQFPWLDDMILGAGVACLLLHLTEKWKQVEQEHTLKPRSLAVLEAPPVVWLGIFSYSLYLLHAPLLAICARIIRDSGFTSIEAYALILVVGVPVTVIGAYVFHRIFERPFMPVHARSGAREWVGALPERALGYMMRGHGFKQLD